MSGGEAPGVREIPGGAAWGGRGSTWSARARGRRRARGRGGASWGMAAARGAGRGVGCSGAARGGAGRAGAGRGAAGAVVAAVDAQPPPPRKSSKASKEKVYIGNGKFIEDDPIKYPGKEDMGPLLGVSGGFAGGERNLKDGDFRRETLPEELKKGFPSKWSQREVVDPAVARPQRVRKGFDAGTDKVYIGHPKGAKGYDGTRYLRDDARLYPDKEDAGFFMGVSGGFAGGEVGLKDQFNQDGEIKLRQGPGRVPVSPLEAAFAIGFLGTFGALAVIKLQEEGVTDAEAAVAFFQGLPAQLSQASQGVEWGPVGAASAVVGGLAVASAAATALKKKADAAAKSAGAAAARLAVLAAAAAVATEIIGTSTN